MQDKTRKRLLLVATYLGPALLSMALAAHLLQLGDADLRVPFEYRTDAIVSALVFKAVIDNGWYLNIPQVGAPGVMHFHDFPGGDTLHLLAVKLLALFSHDWPLLFNGYFLLGFPLITLSAFAVFRHFRVPLAPAATGAILYSFLPTRLLKGEGHMFLDVYYQVPLVLLVALWVCDDDPPLARDRGPGRWPGLEIARPRSILAVIFCVAAALGGVYYACFSAFALVVGGLWATAERRSARNAVAGLGLGALMLATYAMNALPSLLYIAKHGKNLAVAARSPSEAETYGLKIIQLLLPAEGHRVEALRNFTDQYRLSAPLVTENNLVSLGALGSIGFLVLLGAVMLRPRPENPRHHLWRSLGVLNLTAVLLGTLGGFGALFARLVTPNLRAYCRINVIIAFFALFALVLLMERLTRRRALLGWIVAAVVLVVGLYDQVSLPAVRFYADVKAEYDADGAYIDQIEQSLPRDAMIFQLPFVPFPEVRAPGQMLDYDPLRPYVHSHTLRWSYPQMRGRNDDLWTRTVAGDPPARMVDELEGVGFSGVLIDRAGYDDKGAALEAELARALESAAYVSPDGRMAFFNLEPHKAHPRQQLTAEQREARRDMALRPLIITWASGCYEAEAGPQGGFRWCGDTGQIDIANTTTRDKTLSVSMTLVPGNPPCAITVDGDLLPAPVVFAGRDSFERALKVAPGKHALRVHGDGQPVIAPHDSRRLIFRVDNPILREIAAP